MSETCSVRNCHNISKYKGLCSKHYMIECKKIKAKAAFIELELDDRPQGKKIYLCGPMTGLPKYNYRLFNSVAKQLRTAGHFVYSPAEYNWKGPLDKFPIKIAFAAFCNFICLQAEVIVLLPGWEKSLGAKAEQALAQKLEITQVEYKSPVYLYLVNNQKELEKFNVS